MLMLFHILMEFDICTGPHPDRMAAVAEGAPSLEVSAVPGLPDSEPGAEDVKKTIISLSELVDLALCTPEVGWWSEVGGNCDV